MKKTIVLAVTFLALSVVCVFAALETGKEYNLRTALHAVRGDEIYWVNYTDKSTHLKAGDKVVIKDIAGHIIKFDHEGKTYNFAFTEKGSGGPGDLYDKFFTSEDIKGKIKGYPDDVQGKISRGVAEQGMTKEQVLLAVGCPAIIDSQKTYNLGLKDIMSSDKWIYYFNRFNRWQATFKDGKLADIQN